MLRKSLRLQEAGYYTEEGTPIISYKEILYRIFRRRTGHNGRHHLNSIDHNFDYQNSRNNSDNRIIETIGTQDTEISARETQATSQTLTRVSQATETVNRGTHITETLIRANHTWTTGTQIISCFFLLLLLALGITHFTHMHMQLREVQQEVQLLRQQMTVPLADTLPNFALESQGARVLHHLSSDTYWPQGTGIIWDRIFYWWYSSKAQRRVIQGDSSLLPGQCWPFSGEQGHLFISLSHPVSITHVTLGHITKSQSPHGYIASAPREFSIYGMRTTDEEGTYLGTLVYNEDGTAFQTFELPNPDKGVFRHVKLLINNNWGNMDNTCLYSFRVHSQLVK